MKVTICITGKQKRANLYMKLVITDSSQCCQFNLTFFSPAVIACTPSPVPYLDALIPSEHDVLEEPEENQTLEGDMKSADESEEKRDSGDAEGKPKGTEDDGGSTPAKRRHDPEVIDNPFLREPKRPRYKKKK